MIKIILILFMLMVPACSILEETPKFKPGDHVRHLNRNQEGLVIGHSRSAFMFYHVMFVGDPEEYMFRDYELRKVRKRRK
jgi:hypothetical protein